MRNLALTLQALLLTGGLFAGAAQADTQAETDSDCRIESNDLKCTPLSEVKPAGTTGYPAWRTVRLSIPLGSGQWPKGRGDYSLYTYPKVTQTNISVMDGLGQDVSALCPLSVNITHWTHSNSKKWVGADQMTGEYPHNANRIWWAGVLTRSGDLTRCPPGELKVRWRFIADIVSFATKNRWGSLPPVQADFRVLNLKHVSLRVPPVVVLSLSDRGAAGSGMIMLQRWGDISMEVTRADNGGEPSLSSPSGGTTVPLDVTLDTLSGRRNVAKGSSDNVIRWDGRAGENNYRLNITTHGNVKQTLNDEPGPWRSTLRVTVNAL